MSRKCKPRPEYKEFIRDGDLAELIGVILGDGHIQKFPRTERLLIFSNSNNPGFITRYTELVRNTFGKEPYVYKQKDKNCIRISIYEKYISERLGVPSGARKELTILLPEWIKVNQAYQIRFLRGLYEAEGWLCYHPPTYTHKLAFTNLNQSLNAIVYSLLVGLEFHPHTTYDTVQVSRKAEVQNLKDLLQFRDYSS